jgi:glycoside hydrolase-like protein
MTQVLDYSSRPPSGATVRSAGYPGVARYGGTPGRAKNITRAEFEDMDMSGIGVALVYENQAGDALAGYAAGQTSARAILADANSIGFPSNRPFYFAVDKDITGEAQFTAVMSYLDGAASVVGRQRVGVYGEYEVVKRALEGGHAVYGWQTVAWSGGKHYAGAHLYQRVGYVYPGGVQCDVSDVLQADWGQHNYWKVDDDVSWSEELPNPNYNGADPNETGKRSYPAADVLWGTNDKAGRADARTAQILANQAAQAAMLAQILATTLGGGIDPQQVLATIDTAVREATDKAVHDSVLPAVARIESALAADNTEEAKAIVAELGAQLRPAA